MMRVTFGTPDGCNCPPLTYLNRYTWSLYSDSGEFICSGRAFQTWSEAFAVGSEFCQSLPSQQISVNDQN